MRFLQIMPVILTGMIAAFFDLKTGKIPNTLILAALAAGVGWQLFANGPKGILKFAAGAVIPVILLGALFYFRMIGAGDIKLLGAVGGFLGVEKIFICMLWTFLAGGVYACGLLLYRRNLKERLLYFWTYVWNYGNTREWEPYLKVDSVDNRLYFSIPVLISIFFYAGGIY
ncbi:MAG: prepilin peptidase [Eubacteriales bacterium]|nr:prepilin peptidase [Eubacteriales bacterium]